MSAPLLIGDHADLRAEHRHTLPALAHQFRQTLVGDESARRDLGGSRPRLRRCHPSVVRSEAEELRLFIRRITAGIRRRAEV